MNKRSLLESKSLQKEFIHRLSTSLRNFKWKANGANFSCPICGDSQKNLTKARGYLFEKENLYQYFCHNCGFSAKFSFLLGMPIILGASLLHIKDFIEHMREPYFYLGIIISCCSGLIAIRFFMNFVKYYGFLIFAIYRAILAVLILFVM